MPPLPKQDVDGWTSLAMANYRDDLVLFSSALPPGMPADHRFGHRIGRSKIRLDIEERGVVEAVDADHVKRIAFDADKTRHR